jgi:large subunit ribosomal protein L9
MKLILKEDVLKLGDAGDIVDVKPGFGRNYLIPQGKAVLATTSAVNSLESAKRHIAKRAELTVDAAKELAQQLEATSVTISVKVGEEDKIFGSVTNKDVADALAEREIMIDRRKITLNQDIKTPGEYTATIDLLGDLKPEVKVWVVKAE